MVQKITKINVNMKLLQSTKTITKKLCILSKTISFLKIESEEKLD